MVRTVSREENFVTLYLVFLPMSMKDVILFTYQYERRGGMQKLTSGENGSNEDEIVERKHSI